ncbi:PREDICTED: centrosome-associated zinc finger protein CP190 [Cyphomyrmex costatus]|uniref:Centrosome-associated zinc finger protein CP190 n=1 Tax=Cyphomyrmex costatus TaxID=456900 RepID=A0A195CVU2_9HYME|nr:PREDICTED: centrosome-associated zinc finger protein CP190 [Cyphomyrmex costatus]XP_018393107.1 PREDICTED: centrosome-associated zinc finger protein CP190 [Cyphomyrmex costatus]XP_018393108.1 PREDICTED: centrosome-associated zinc finger protein CP190 [Cyphomyrmex costatus]XP_018393109.1 PREDICTED: centrosome-associated zinc finger protein CP190 [Cyphomyrmex costatus]KYN04796.1 hypothetical protein ALC62_04180 [Cyphomyrmex costatus]
MEPGVIQEKPLPMRGLKQVKVDNWGSFFLQRLQTLYLDEQFLDLKIKFPTSNITVQAHRLVVTTCTDYFMQLEEQQKEKDENFDGIIMPSDMPYECVKSIISFMYTGQLEYWTSEQHALYRTAQKMNMTVLTKLLEAQFNTSKIQDDTAKTPPMIAVTKPSTPPIPKTVTSPISSTSNVQTLPGRKLPIWKRKLDESPPVPANYEVRTFHNTSSIHKEVTPGPSRFDLPEAEDFALGLFSSFDDITYNTKPIVRACNTYTKENSIKGSPDRDSKNDTTEDEDEDNQESEKNLRNTNLVDDWNISKNYERSEEGPSKRVRFDLEEKENVEKSKTNHDVNPNTDDSIDNHAKIIREVLKKYPHLVKNNKNIRLKIMQKETKSSENNTASKTKISYVVLKSDHLLTINNDENNDSKCNGSIDGETGPWKCNKCDLDEEYTNYYMYRRHMQDVHDEKFDPRVCEHCGYKATKRNILMYHLYTKHNVPPPKSMSFPKCHACSYIALSETLLVRHQINHNHRPAATRHYTSEDIQCNQCSQSFKSITELTTHELNSGHGNVTDGKGHRCPYCCKVFVRLTNLQVHLDCAHKELQRDTTESPSAVPALEPSSEAEALSHVASGIAASLGVGDIETETPETQEEEIEIVKTNDNQYIVPNVLNNMEHNISYGAHELEGQHMIMLVNNDENYQHGENNHHQQPQQLDIADNEQIVMQGTDDGMIVYIHGAEEADNRSYENYQHGEVIQETEEIVEEVVEEVEEVVMEEERVQEEEEMPQHMLEDCADNQVEEVVQYVEEQTEIVEYDEEQCSEQSNNIDEQQDSVMIIEEEHVESEEDMEETTDKKIQSFTTEWDEDSAGLTES